MVVIWNKGKRNIISFSTKLCSLESCQRKHRVSGTICRVVTVLSRLMVCQQPACEDCHYLFYQMHCSLTVLWGMFRFLTISLTNFVQGLIFDNFWIFMGIEAWTCFFPSHILISRNYFLFYIPTPVPSPSLLPFPIHFLEGVICHLVQMFNLIFW